MIITDRAITLTQPWATLMAIGAKKFETRSRPSSFRGWLAVHAAKSWPQECVDLASWTEFRRALYDDGPWKFTIADIRWMLGRVLAVVHVVACVRTDTLTPGMYEVSKRERAFGDYTPGRYYYVTDAVRRLREPFAARGFQSIPWRLKTPITEDMLR